MIYGQNTDKSSDNLILYFDQVFAHLIYGLVAQMLAFSVCNVWMIYLPTLCEQTLFTTYVYSLYVTKKIPELKQLTHEQTDIEMVFSNIANFILSITLFFKQPEHRDQNSPNTLHALSYLVALLCIYNIPAILGIAAAYIILSLSHSTQLAQNILNIKILTYSALYSILLSITHPAALFAQTMLSLMILTEIYPSTTEASNLSMAENCMLKIQQSFELIIDAIIPPLPHHSGKTKQYEPLVHILILLVVISPVISVLPVFSFIPYCLNSGAGKVLQAVISTHMLGEKLKYFFFPKLSANTQQYKLDKQIVIQSADIVASTIRKASKGFFGKPQSDTSHDISRPA